MTALPRHARAPEQDGSEALQTVLLPRITVDAPTVDADDRAQTVLLSRIPAIPFKRLKAPARDAYAWEREQDPDGDEELWRPELFTATVKTTGAVLPKPPSQRTEKYLYNNRHMWMLILGMVLSAPFLLYTQLGFLANSMRLWVLFPVVMMTPVANSANAEGLPARWWDDFSAAMDELAGQETTRVATPDCMPISVDRIETTIRKVFPDCGNLVIDEWSTAHADLNWANLTGPALWILDWEDWGRAPRGLDAANLWASSLAVPQVANKILESRRPDLDSRTGRIMMLFKCAELLGWADEREPLYTPTRREAERLRSLLAA